LKEDRKWALGSNDNVNGVGDRESGVYDIESGVYDSVFFDAIFGIFDFCPAQDF